ncbi:MAG: class I SAM-dependent methyltransferase [Streptosporangiaceae bacterium]
MTSATGSDRTPSLQAALRSYWNADAATYDQAVTHIPRSAAVNAAWAAALLRLLPPPPANVLDVGAGTGFLAMNLARLGYQVTALDSAPAMLEQLTAKASGAALAIETVCADAADPPDGPFHAVVQRHLIWTLPDPGQALNAWHQAAPTGRLVLFESVWGSAADPAERLRSYGRRLVRRLHGDAHEHHAEYDPQWQAALPLGTGTSPEALTSLLSASSWGPSRLHRLRDIEWTTLAAMSPTERIFGVAPRFAVTAGDPARH